MLAPDTTDRVSKVRLTLNVFFYCLLKLFHIFVVALNQERKRKISTTSEKMEHCSFSINGSVHPESFLFLHYTDYETQISVQAGLEGCGLNVLAVGGGGRGAGLGQGGGGSGHVRYTQKMITEDLLLKVRVGGSNQSTRIESFEDSSLTWTFEAAPGQNGDKRFGGGGYSGGGYNGTSGGEAGADGQGSRAGRGSGQDIRDIPLWYFCLGPGHAGSGNQHTHAAGGGGGVRVGKRYGPPVIVSGMGRGFGGTLRCFKLKRKFRE